MWCHAGVIHLIIQPMLDTYAYTSHLLAHDTYKRITWQVFNMQYNILFHFCNATLFSSATFTPLHKCSTCNVCWFMKTIGCNTSLPSQNWRKKTPLISLSLSLSRAHHHPTTVTILSLSPFHPHHHIHHNIHHYHHNHLLSLSCF
jgi:hypothetical protein